MRRLPVYLLLDCSESMIGGGINSVQEGVETMLRSLRTDPHALESVWLSCIGFDTEARLLFPLTELTEVQVPKLRVRPGTAIGAALNLCADRIEKEVRRTTVVQKGDWRPLVILLTDGQATDNWDSAIARLGQSVRPRPANIYAIGCGDDVDVAALRELTDIVMHVSDMSEEQMRRLFVWLTASVTQNSRGVHESDDRRIDLSKLPDCVVPVDHDVARREGPARQVFIYAQCVKNRQPYLMRYRLEEHYGIYMPVAAYPMEIETEKKREKFAMPPVSSEQLNGAPPCPHCYSIGAGRCGRCGAIFCSDPFESGDIVCPGCLATMRRRRPGEEQDPFDVRQSLA